MTPELASNLDAPAAPRIEPLRRNRDFRTLLVGQGASAIGGGFALASIGVALLAASALAR